MRKLAFVAAAALVATLASPAHALEPQNPRVIESSSQFISDGLYRVAYTGELWEVDNEDNSARAISLDEWNENGNPGFSPAPTDYVKYPWSPKIYGVTFFGQDPSTWLWDPLTLQDWQAAGSPAPRAAGFIKGSTIFKFGGSPELFLDEDSALNSESDSLVASQPAHKLTFAEWRATGFVPPEELDAEILRLSWDTSGAVFVQYEQFYGTQLGFEEYQAIGSPTPQTVRRLPGDAPANYSVYRQENPLDSRLVYYNGFFDYKKVLTYQEWVAMGSPTPGAPNYCADADNLGNSCEYDRSAPELILE